jgi:two-component system chemotaxis response regulator CheB
MDRILRVLIVDDSAYIRKVIKQMLSRSPFIEVVGAAGTGEEALSLVEELHPDVVTMDLIMPGMGGIGFIREQMARAPLPIVVVSIAGDGSQLALDALDSGAIDFIQKPSALATEKVFEMSDELIGKVKAAAGVHFAGSKPVYVARAASAGGPSHSGTAKTAPSVADVILIGTSTGGPQALKYLVPRLPADFPLPVVIVMHMPVGYTDLYAQRLNDLSPLNIREAREGDVVQKGNVFIAPAGRHLTFERKGRREVVVHLDARPFDTMHRPSVDVLFHSAAEAFGNRVLGVVMTGMGDDGKEGAAAIKSKGGLIFAESEESCVVYGMPRVIVEAGLASRIIPLSKMADAIVGVAYGENPNRR